MVRVENYYQAITLSGVTKRIVDQLRTTCQQHLLPSMYQHNLLLLPSLLLLLRNLPSSLDQRIQRFKLYLMKSSMRIQRDTYHHKQFIRSFLSYLQPHHLRRRMYRHHLLHQHLHQRKCCHHHRNRCSRSHPQK